MAFWLCLIVAITIGIATGGFSALQQARNHEFSAANRLLWRGAWCAAITAVVLCVVLLKYPFRDVRVSATEEVTIIIKKTIEVPVKVGRWIFPEWFFPTTGTTTVEVETPVTKSITRELEERRFSFLLLFLLAFLGWLAYYSELLLVRLLWRGIPGLRWLQRH